MSVPDIKEVVKKKYAEAALRVTVGGSSCCGSSPASPSLSLIHISQGLREQKLLDTFGKENPTNENADPTRSIRPHFFCVYRHCSLFPKHRIIRGEINLFKCNRTGS